MTKGDYDKNKNGHRWPSCDFYSKTILYKKVMTECVSGFL